VRENYKAWVDGGSKGIIERATEVARNLMQTHEINPLPPEADRELAKILIAAEKEKLKA
jgi:trimethylamine:corrinoid methyltransferase-like protein